jgi:hypothetical protein
MSGENKTAAQICAVAGVTDEARALLREGLGPREYVDLLVDKKHYPDAILFLAHSLPKREAVWWAWVCARRNAGATPPAKVKAALDATEKWIAQPTDQNRRAVFEMADQADLGSPAGCAGLAAFVSGGSLGPPDGPVVPPAEDMTAKAVSGAVTLAADAEEPEQMAENCRNFIKQGLEVASRIKLW